VAKFLKRGFVPFEQERYETSQPQGQWKRSTRAGLKQTG
jgi:hypothetical protein